MNEDVYVAIADPEGSGLFNKVTLVFELLHSSLTFLLVR